MVLIPSTEWNAFLLVKRIGRILVKKGWKFGKKGPPLGKPTKKVNLSKLRIIRNKFLIE